MGFIEFTDGDSRQDVSYVQPALVAVTASWYEAVFGHGAISDVLGELCQVCGAEAALLVRTNSADATAIRVAAHDRGRRAAGGRPLTKSFAREHFGDLFQAARPGTVWIGSSISHPEDIGPGSLADWQRSRGTHEFVVIVLTGGNGMRDHIELHFRDRLPAQEYRSIAVLAPTMARSWAMRRVGLVAGILASARSLHKQSVGEKPGERHLLSAGNPARLSRTEFRLCLLLSQGLSASAVAEQMSLAETTVRSHLRSIYAKTEASGITDLVYRLIAQPSQDAPPRRARA